MKESLYSIGEVAKLTDVSIKALRYYDKIDLFKPAYIDPNTNYRYYKDAQLHQLDLIKSLKYIGTSIEKMKEVQSLMDDEIIGFFHEQEAMITEKIQALLEIKQSIQLARKRMERQKEYLILGEVFFLEEAERTIIRTSVSGMSPKDVLASSYSELKKLVESTNQFMNNGYGAIFPFECYPSFDTIEYRYLYTPILTHKPIGLLKNKVELTTIPQGTYACIAFIYSPETYFSNYQKLYSFINTSHLQAEGPVFELFVPKHYSPNHEAEYMVEIKVQIKE